MHIQEDASKIKELPEHLVKTPECSARHPKESIPLREKKSSEILFFYEETEV